MSAAARRSPLAGRRILITRARRQAGSLATLLRQQGATVIQVPAIEIRPPKSFRPLDRALAHLASYDWLILTSVNGVEAMFARMAKRHVRFTDRERPKIAAIGPATKRAIEESGLKVSVMPREYVAESVVRELRAKVRGKRVLLVRAKVARDVIPRELRRAGARVDVVEAYETVVPKDSARRLHAILGGKRKPDAITFTSSSTARNLMALVGDKASLRGVVLASIGPVTSATLRELGLRPTIEAKEYTMAGLVKAIVSARKK
jgi:uroporphyrinogen-III synthase